MTKRKPQRHSIHGPPEQGTLDGRPKDEGSMLETLRREHPERLPLFDQGHALFKREPELTLTEVYWRAPRGLLPSEQQQFVDGYRAARRQADEFNQEKKSDHMGKNTASE